MKLAGKRQVHYSANSEPRIRYAVLAIGGLTIAAGALLSTNETASNRTVFWALSTPTFMMLLGALIVISCLAQTIIVKYDITERQTPSSKIGSEFGADDAEIVLDTEQTRLIENRGRSFGRA